MIELSFGKVRRGRFSSSRKPFLEIPDELIEMIKVATKWDFVKSRGDLIEFAFQRVHQGIHNLIIGGYHYTKAFNQDVDKALVILYQLRETIAKELTKRDSDRICLVVKSKN